MYEDIPLHTYLEIGATGNYHLLIVSGEFNDKELEKHFEEITKRNAQQNNDFAYQAYYNNIKTYGQLIEEYELVKLELSKLKIVIDDDSIGFLKDKGYRIDINGTATRYAQTIQAAEARSNSILTKIQMKANELKLEAEKADKNKSEGIEEVLAGMSTVLGWNIPSDITLARFNKYRKIVKDKLQKGKAKKVG